MQTCLVLCLALLAPVLADECPDGGECEEGNTCCKVPANGYECCPLHQAECCEDHKHCCPEGTTCVVDESKCVNATVTLPWVERVSAKPSGSSKSFRMIKSLSVDEDDNICPDASHCPAEFTCLSALRGYGCCPLAQGVPCSDGKHCCPESHQCSEDCSSCIQQQKAQPISAVMCGDSESECPDQTTCCTTPDGSMGCCPMPKAVCCEDMVHCCPEGSTCDIQQSKCISSTNKQMPMWAKFPARKRADWENLPDVQVAVTAASNSYSNQQTGIATANTSPFTGAGIMGVPCDDTSACPDGTTCCKSKEGTWSCCPMPEAVCCDDFVHCCPKGKKCNMVVGQCDDPLGSVPWLEKVPTKPFTRTGIMGVPCDDTGSCPDGTTCCKSKEGTWSCCPMPEAVCCNDFVHCCPKGTKCNLAEGKCDKILYSVPWLEKIPTKPWKAEAEAGGVVCDPSHTCPDDNTCCTTSTGEWACCPLPEAVCCADHEHCCPKGTTCDPNTISCKSSTGSVPMVVKVAAHTTLKPEDASTESPRSTAATKLQTQDDDYYHGDEDNDKGQDGKIQCDDTTTCPIDTTCCLMASSQQWGCCPLPDAVCCKDGEHCCPHGYTCDGDNKCTKGAVMIPWYNKLVAEAENRLPSPTSVVCGGTSVTCEDGETCCKTSATTWGCCSLSDAVCCSDMKHCCPAGYICGAAGSCSKSKGFSWSYWHARFSIKKRGLGL